MQMSQADEDLTEPFVLSLPVRLAWGSQALNFLHPTVAFLLELAEKFLACHLRFSQYPIKEIDRDHAVHWNCQAPSIWVVEKHMASSI
jgi:hypothetical protein